MNMWNLFEKELDNDEFNIGKSMLKLPLPKEEELYRNVFDVLASNTGIGDLNWYDYKV